MARDGSPRVDLSELDKATERSLEVLLDANSDTNPFEFFFLFGNQPYRLDVEKETGRLIPEKLTEKEMKNRLSKIAVYGYPHKTDKEWRIYPGATSELVRNVLAEQNLPLPVLRRIVEIPVLSPDGRVHSKPGYNESSRAFYAPTAGLAVPPIPQRPSRGQLEVAVSLILDQMLEEFPFVGDSERAHAFCLTLQPFVRD
jgi:hypothetical protein